MFNQIFKHLEVRQKYSATPRISTLFSVFGEASSFVFDITPRIGTMKEVNRDCLAGV